MFVIYTTAVLNSQFWLVLIHFQFCQQFWKYMRQFIYLSFICSYILNYKTDLGVEQVLKTCVIIDIVSVVSSDCIFTSQR